MKNDELAQLNFDLEELETELKSLENGENEEEYDNMLDELSEVKIGNIEFCASRVLKELDPIAYNCGLSDFNDERISELENEIEDKKEEIEDKKEELKENAGL